jgi:uncharacterized OsmC-like protein
MTALVIYKGQLRCECTHLQSGSNFETDAPTDNRGKGEKFSPTDTLCISLATCIITTIGIRAMDVNIDLANTKIDVTKHMLSNPRRIGGIDITVHFPLVNIEHSTKEILEKIGDHCPVMKSLHPEIVINTKYIWN